MQDEENSSGEASTGRESCEAGASQAETLSGEVVSGAQTHGDQPKATSHAAASSEEGMAPSILWCTPDCPSDRSAYYLAHRACSIHFNAAETVSHECTKAQMEPAWRSASVAHHNAEL